MGEKSIIIGTGRGSGLSTYLSANLKIQTFPSRLLDGLNFKNYNHIIYTSCDPSFDLNKTNITNYLEKNIINIYKIINSGFKGIFTYISSVESGFYQVYSLSQEKKIEKMFTPYSFSKYTAELLLTSNNNFTKTNILKLGFIWPGREESNLSKAIFSSPNEISINYNSCFFITPRSLVLDFIKNQSNVISKKIEIGYLSSSNKVYIKDILKLRNLDYSFKNDEKFLYVTKAKENNIMSLLTSGSFNWEEKEDFNPLIGDALNIEGKEVILPNR